MKNTIKFILILLLVVASIGGTCYMFYSNLVERKDAFAHLTTFLSASDNYDLRLSVVSINEELDHRYDVALETIIKLDNVSYNLNTYMIKALDSDVDTNEIIDRINYALDGRAELSDNINEFMLKHTHKDFDKVQAGNYILSSLASYIIRYADMVQYLNTEIETKIITNPNSDIKFELIELYCLVAKDCYANLSNNEVKKENDVTNINYMNRKLEIVDGIISTQLSTDFSKYNNLFINAFENLDKASFANKLITNINATSSLTETSSQVEKAAFYLKNILGI